MFQEIDVIPELNFWFRRELSNASVYDTFHKIPVEVDDSWREPRSVIELLFNECFDPGPYEPSSSSSGDTGNIEYENDKPYIYLYRRVNLLRITDKVLLQRIQPYRWWANVYAANSLKFIELFNMQGSQLDPGFYPRNETILPYDVAEEDRSPFITYQNWNASFTNYPLWHDHQGVNVDTEPAPPIYQPPHIFDFTDLTLEMLDKLWFYKTDCPWVTLDDINYEDLDSCIAQLIYIYLDAFINDSYTYYNSEQSLCDGSDILGSLYEKHVLDMVYLLRSKLYGVIWKDSVIISDRLHEINENFFIILKKVVERRRVDELAYQNGEFVLEGDNLPWDRRDFTFFKDGVILEQDVDYTMVVEASDPTNIHMRIILLRDDFEYDELVEFIWSYADPYSAYSEVDA
jgi:hypothetical protein